MPDRLLDIPVVAERTGKTRAAVIRDIRAGIIPAKKFFGARSDGGRTETRRPRYRVLESALDKFISELPDAVVEDPVPTARRRGHARNRRPNPATEPTATVAYY